MDSSTLLPARLMPEASLGVPRDLIASAKRFADNARSANTTKAYQGDWTRFVEWCATVNLCPLPCSPETLALYLTFRAEAGRKPCVIERDMAALSVVHRLAGHDLPRRSPLVREVMGGIRRTLKVAPNQATPLLPVDLKIISMGLPKTLAGRRDRALLLLGFAGAFRVSELSNLRIEDLRFGEDGLTVNLRVSKTDQEGKGRLVGIPRGGDPFLCPVRAVQCWLEESHLQKGWVFRRIARHDLLQVAKISAQGIALMIHDRAKQSGLQAPKVSGHSLRSGLVTTAARAGKSMTSIQRQTGHKSIEMVARYVRDATLFAENAASGIGL